jgi:predicted lipid-binding transport protein (Tim44 family)
VTGGLVIVSLLIPEVALARGGGGGHSSGGGGGGGGRSLGGGGGGIGGGGGFFFFPLFLGSGGGGGLDSILCLVLIVVVIYYAFIRPRMRGGFTDAASAYADGPPSAPMSPVAYSDPNAGMAEIMANDPGFNQQAFLDRAQAAFFLLQKAWQDRNVDEGRAYMSPGLYMSWKSQVDQMLAQHKKNILENLFIQGMHVARAIHDANFDQITVRVDASAMDYEVDDQTGKEVFAVGGRKADRPFTEYWTFQRSAGAKTLVSGGVTEKKCPNCGAPLDVNETGDCRYCGAAVTSGKFDWVLSKIDQANEWEG